MSDPISEYSFDDVIRPIVNGKNCIEELQSEKWATSIPGMIKNAEGRISDKITYARITVKRSDK